MMNVIFDMKIEESSVLVPGTGRFIVSHLLKHLTKIGADVGAFVRYTSSGNIGNLIFSVQLMFLLSRWVECPDSLRESVDCISYL